MMMKVHSNSICILKKDGKSPSDRRPALCRQGWAGGVWAERNRSCSPSCAWLCQCCAHKEQHRAVFTNTVGTQCPLPKTTHIHTRTHMHACTHTDLVAKAVRCFVNAVHTKNRGFIFSLTQSEPRTHSPQQPPRHTHMLQTNTPVHTHTHTANKHTCTHTRTNARTCTQTRMYARRRRHTLKKSSYIRSQFPQKQKGFIKTKTPATLQEGCVLSQGALSQDVQLLVTTLSQKQTSSKSQDTLHFPLSVSPL